MRVLLFLLFFVPVVSACPTPLRGTVLADGYPVSKASVRMYAGAVFETRITNSFGRFDFGEVPDSNVGIEVVSRGHERFLTIIYWWQYEGIELRLDGKEMSFYEKAINGLDTIFAYQPRCVGMRK